MLLFRARTIASRPRRLPVYEGNTPEHRIRGRWFTSDLEAAVRHKARLSEPAEVVVIELDDALASGFLVANTPKTPCGLEPWLHSANHHTDYVLPKCYALEAEVVELPADESEPAADGIREAANDRLDERLARVVTIGIRHLAA